MNVEGSIDALSSLVVFLSPPTHAPSEDSFLTCICEKLSLTPSHDPNDAPTFESVTLEVRLSSMSSEDGDRSDLVIDSYSFANSLPKFKKSSISVILTAPPRLSLTEDYSVSAVIEDGRREGVWKVGRFGWIRDDINLKRYRQCKSFDTRAIEALTGI